ncbi:unnamed protein product [Ectocarpus fasciculatus]
MCAGRSDANLTLKHLVLLLPDHPITAMMHPAPVFVAVLAAIRFSGAICFTMVTPRSSSSSHHVARHVSSAATTRLVTSSPPSSSPCSRTTHTDSSMFAPIEARAMSSLTRWQSRLGASGETLGEENIANPEEESEVASSSGATNSEPGAGGVAGVDLSKGIAFEAPKPKVLEPENAEEESDSKKVRVIIYTVLSLVPFVLLLPFLGGRELMPLDPSQM